MRSTSGSVKATWQAPAAQGSFAVLDPTREALSVPVHTPAAHTPGTTVIWVTPTRTGGEGGAVKSKHPGPEQSTGQADPMLCAHPGQGCQSNDAVADETQNAVQEGVHVVESMGVQDATHDASQVAWQVASGSVEQVAVHVAVQSESHVVASMGVQVGVHDSVHADVVAGSG